MVVWLSLWMGVTNLVLGGGPKEQRVLLWEAQRSPLDQGAGFRLEMKLRNPGTKPECTSVLPGSAGVRYRVRGSTAEWNVLKPSPLSDNAQHSAQPTCIEPGRTSSWGTFEVRFHATPNPLLLDLEIPGGRRLSGVRGLIEVEYEWTEVQNLQIKPSSGPHVWAVFAPRALLEEFQNKPEEMAVLFGPEHREVRSEVAKLLHAGPHKFGKTRAILTALRQIGGADSRRELLKFASEEKANEQLRIEAFRWAAELCERGGELEFVGAAERFKGAEFNEAPLLVAIRAIVGVADPVGGPKLLAELESKKAWKSVRRQIQIGRVKLGDTKAMKDLVQDLKRMSSSDLANLFGDWLDPREPRSSKIFAQVPLAFFGDTRRGRYLGQGHGHDPVELQKWVTVGDWARFVAIDLLRQADVAVPKDFVRIEALREFSPEERVVIDRWVKASSE